MKPSGKGPNSQRILRATPEGESVVKSMHSEQLETLYKEMQIVKFQCPHCYELIDCDELGIEGKFKQGRENGNGRQDQR